MPSPPIQKFMSPAPYIVADSHKLDYAAKLMRQHHIRHLPVLKDGKLVGVLSSEETNAALVTGNLDQLVRDVMNPKPYSVSLDTPLGHVAAAMATQRHAIAVVTNHGNVVGVFTTVDGMRALASLFEERRPG